MLAADWVTISALATAGGTLVLALATFASVRSANRAARVAELSLFAGLRPLLVPSKLDDPPQKIGFVDDKWVMAEGGRGVAEVGENAIYLALALRNVGAGIAVLDGWSFLPGRRLEEAHPEPKISRGSRATSTSRSGTSASGKARFATRLIPSSPLPGRRSRGATG